MDLYPQDINHPSQISVGYFYIKEDQQQLHDLNSMLKSIALRFTTVDRTYKKHAVRVCRSIRNISTPQDTWKSLFLDFYTSDRYDDHFAFIVIDGLDEAPKKAVQGFLDLLEDLAKLQTPLIEPQVRFIVFGRPELTEHIRNHRNQRSLVVGDKSHNDIDRYIKVNLKKVLVVREEYYTQSKSHAEKLGRQIRKAILEKANGLFFWVKVGDVPLKGLHD